MNTETNATEVLYRFTYTESIHDGFNRPERKHETIHIFTVDESSGLKAQFAEEWRNIRNKISFTSLERVETNTVDWRPKKEK